MSDATTIQMPSGDAPTRTRNGVSFELILDQSVYVAFPPQAAALGATLVLDNRNSVPLPLAFANGQQFDIAIRDANGTQVALWSAGRIFDDLAQTVEVKGRHTWQASMNVPLGAGAAFPEAAYAATAWLTASAPATQGTTDRPYTATVRFSVRAAPVVLQQRPA